MIRDSATIRSPTPLDGHERCASPIGLQPTFIKVPSNISATEGKMVRFDCRVRGRPLPDVTWYRDGVMLIDDQTHKILVNEQGIHSLMITVATVGDAGTYTCVAKNKNGEASFEVNLVVDQRQAVVAPKFVERFQTSHIKEGDQCELACRAQGVPVPLLSWQKDGNHIQSQPPYLSIMTEEDRSTLTINKASGDDAGWYQCSAVNLAGSAATRARVYVTPAPRQPGELWHLNLPKPSKVIAPEVGPDSETIWLRHVEPSAPHIPRDFGADLTITPPRFITKCKNVRIIEGQVAHFDCKIEPINDPSLKVEWFHNGQSLMIGSRFQLFNDFGYVFLNILQCIVDDSGIYTCRATNRLGYDEIQVTLEVITTTSVDTDTDVEGLQKFQYLEDSSRHTRVTQVEEEIIKKPRFLTNFKDVIINEGQNAHFECRVEPTNDSSLQVQWFHNERALTIGSRFQHYLNFGYISLDILQCIADDSGVYKCRITTKLGVAETTVNLRCIGSADLQMNSQNQDSLQRIRYLEDSTRFERQLTMDETIESKPKFLNTFLDLLVVEGGSAHFESRIEPSNDPNLTIEWFHNQNQLTIGK